MSVYDFTVKTMDGNEKSLADYEGKVLLIVNTATICGFTPQYEGLQEMYEQNAKKGFEILDFPCNQFNNQAPGDDAEIHAFCTGRFGVTFPQFSKSTSTAITRFPFIGTWCGKKALAVLIRDMKKTPVLEERLAAAHPNFRNEPDIKWNFTKFLVDRKGKVVERFEPTTDLKVVAAAVEALL